MKLLAIISFLLLSVVYGQWLELQSNFLNPFRFFGNGMKIFKRGENKSKDIINIPLAELKKRAADLQKIAEESNKRLNDDKKNILKPCLECDEALTALQNQIISDMKAADKANLDLMDANQDLKAKNVLILQNRNFDVSNSLDNINDMNLMILQSLDAVAKLKGSSSSINQRDIDNITGYTLSLFDKQADLTTHYILALSYSFEAGQNILQDKQFIAQKLLKDYKESQDLAENAEDETQDALNQFSKYPSNLEFKLAAAQAQIASSLASDRVNELYFQLVDAQDDLIEGMSSIVDQSKDILDSIQSISTFIKVLIDNLSTAFENEAATAVSVDNFIDFLSRALDKSNQLGKKVKSSVKDAATNMKLFSQRETDNLNNILDNLSSDLQTFVTKQEDAAKNYRDLQLFIKNNPDVSENDQNLSVLGGKLEFYDFLLQTQQDRMDMLTDIAFDITIHHSSDFNVCKRDIVNDVDSLIHRVSSYQQRLNEASESVDAIEFEGFVASIESSIQLLFSQTDTLTCYNCCNDDSYDKPIYFPSLLPPLQGNAPLTGGSSSNINNMGGELSSSLSKGDVNSPSNVPSSSNGDNTHTDSFPSSSSNKDDNKSSVIGDSDSSLSSSNGDNEATDSSPLSSSPSSSSNKDDNKSLVIGDSDSSLSSSNGDNAPTDYSPSSSTDNDNASSTGKSSTSPSTASSTSVSSSLCVSAENIELFNSNLSIAQSEVDENQKVVDYYEKIIKEFKSTSNNDSSEVRRAEVLLHQAQGSVQKLLQKLEIAASNLAALKKSPNCSKNNQGNATSVSSEDENDESSPSSPSSKTMSSTSVETSSLSESILNSPSTSSESADKLPALPSCVTPDVLLNFHTDVVLSQTAAQESQKVVDFYKSIDSELNENSDAEKSDINQVDASLHLAIKKSQNSNDAVNVAVNRLLEVNLLPECSSGAVDDSTTSIPTIAATVQCVPNYYSYNMVLAYYLDDAVSTLNEWKLANFNQSPVISKAVIEQIDAMKELRKASRYDADGLNDLPNLQGQAQDLLTKEYCIPSFVDYDLLLRYYLDNNVNDSQAWNSTGFGGLNNVDSDIIKHVESLKSLRVSQLDPVLISNLDADAILYLKKVSHIDLDNSSQGVDDSQTPTTSSSTDLVQNALEQANQKLQIKQASDDELQKASANVKNLLSGIHNSGDVEDIIADLNNNQNVEMNESAQDLSDAVSLISTHDISASNEYTSLSAIVADSQNKVDLITSRLKSLNVVLNVLVQQNVDPVHIQKLQLQVNGVQQELDVANQDLYDANEKLDSYKALDSDKILKNLNDNIINAQNVVYAKLLTQENASEVLDELVSSNSTIESIDSANQTLSDASQDLKHSENDLDEATRSLALFKQNANVFQSTDEIRSNFQRLQEDVKSDQNQYDVALADMQTKQLIVSSLNTEDQAEIQKAQNDLQDATDNFNLLQSSLTLSTSALVKANQDLWIESRDNDGVLLYTNIISGESKRFVPTIDLSTLENMKNDDGVRSKVCLGDNCNPEGVDKKVTIPFPSPASASSPTITSEAQSFKELNKLEKRISKKEEKIEMKEMKGKKEKEKKVKKKEMQEKSRICMGDICFEE